MSTLIDQLSQSTNIIISGTGADNSLAELVFISLFTDARAADYDELPDASNDKRGWPGDTYASSPWGGKLWLLKRQKLTSDIKNLSIKYAENALAWMLVDEGNGAMAKSVVVTASIPRLNTLALSVVVTKPTGENMTITVTEPWDAQYAV